MNFTRRNFLNLLGVAPISVNLFGIIPESNLFGVPFTTIYKITNKYSESLLSDLAPIFKLKYKVGEITIPKIGKIYTYPNKPIKIDYSDICYECRTKSKPLLVAANTKCRETYWEYEDSIKNFWSRFNPDKPSIAGETIALCDSVEVIKDISNEILTI